MVKNCEVKPASTGEITAPSDRNPAQVAIVFARALTSGTSATIIDSEIGKRMPAPMPPTAWARIITCAVGASAAIREPSVTVANPANSRRLRP